MSGSKRFCLVPNAPCGVERDMIYSPSDEDEKFLMHRVELKAFRPS